MLRKVKAILCSFILSPVIIFKHFLKNHMANLKRISCGTYLDWENENIIRDLIHITEMVVDYISFLSFKIRDYTEKSEILIGLDLCSRSSLFNLLDPF